MGRILLPLTFAALLLVVPTRADELVLKDGSTIVGTIVAFEESSFKVQTSYGFALVQRDQVTAIRMGDSGKKSSTDKNPPPAGKPVETVAVSPKASKGEAEPPASESEPHSSPAAPMKNLATSGVAPSVPVIPTSTKRIAPAAPPAVVKEIARSLAALTVPALPVSVAEPPKPAPAEPMREEISGNAYQNESFGFRMYKPPDWQLIPGARTLLPGSIAAMGTGDENTYLLIGEQPAGKSLAADIGATERRLSDIMENFRAGSENRMTVSGVPGIERRFRGTVDQREWSGVVVCVPRNGQIFTVFGMTYAENDLVQIQENILDRTIASIQFTSN
jgi:hypothetical protein